LTWNSGVGSPVADERVLQPASTLNMSNNTVATNRRSEPVNLSDI